VTDAFVKEKEKKKESGNKGRKKNRLAEERMDKRKGWWGKETRTEKNRRVDGQVSGWINGCTDL
jgi:hypothetical protein